MRFLLCRIQEVYFYTIKVIEIDAISVARP